MDQGDLDPVVSLADQEIKEKVDQSDPLDPLDLWEQLGLVESVVEMEAQDQL